VLALPLCLVCFAALKSVVDLIMLHCAPEITIKQPLVLQAGLELVNAGEPCFVTTCLHNVH
jgi:hypothetical protein